MSQIVCECTCTVLAGQASSHQLINKKKYDQNPNSWLLSSTNTVATVEDATVSMSIFDVQFIKKIQQQKPEHLVKWFLFSIYITEIIK